MEEEMVIGDLIVGEVLEEDIISKVVAQRKTAEVGYFFSTFICNST